MWLKYKILNVYKKYEKLTVPKTLRIITSASFDVLGTSIFGYHILQRFLI